MPANSLRSARYLADSRLHSTVWPIGTLATLGSVDTWSPGFNICDWAPCATLTEPSMTETREPFTPRLTAKTVPLTDTRQSGVRTSRVPARCLAAWTMTSPRSSRMVAPVEAAVTDSSVRSFNSTREPSARRMMAVEPLEVRMCSPGEMSRPEKIGVLPRSETAYKMPLTDWTDI